MLANKNKEDPLFYIYEDIADHFKESHFKREQMDMKDKSYRHQRYKITGFRVLIPVGKKVKPEEALQVCTKQLTKLFWASEMAGHTRATVDDFDLG